MSRKGYPKNQLSFEQARWKWFDIHSGALVYDTGNYGGASYTMLAADSSGPNTPGWPAVKLVNPYQGYRFKAWVTRANWHGEAGPVGGPFTLTGGGTYPFMDLMHFNPAADFNGGFLEGLTYSKVVQKLQDAVKDQKVNVPLLAAEFHKTCGTVTDAANRIAGAIRDVRRGNLSNAIRRLAGGRRRGGGGRRPPANHPPNSGSVSRDWLALQYGWKPLLSDVYGSAEELAATMNYRPPAKQVRASASAKDEKPFFQGTTSNFPAIKGVRRLQTSTRGVINYRLSPSATAVSLGFSNPLAVAWELVPYSFVADWFIGVGGFLNRLDYALGVDFVSGWITHKTTGSWDISTVSGTYSGGGATQTWSGGNYFASVEALVRIPFSSFPSVSLPNWKDPLSLTHASNAIALLRTAFGR